jgi:cyclic beta-1,2-glucan synthetase
MNEVQRLASQLERSWDGEWYRRGYYDDGTPLGSAHNDECSIDSISQSWAVLSGAVPMPFAERAMDAVRTSLVTRESQMLLLLNPPFDHSAQDPGYIKGYPPGVRENGGQYTHAAQWVVLALTRLGCGAEAVELFHMLNPVNHARTRATSLAQDEPSVMETSMPGPHARRPGAGTWVSRLDVRAGIRSILGLRRRGLFTIDPCIPSSWPEYRITWQFRTAATITCNPARRCRGVATATLDGVCVDAARMPLVNDGRTHDVRIVLGDQSRR